MIVLMVSTTISDLSSLELDEQPQMRLMKFGMVILLAKKESPWLNVTTESFQRKILLNF